MKVLGRPSPYFLAASLIGLCTIALALSVLGTGGEDSLARYQHGQPLRVGYAIEAPFVMLDAHGRTTGEAPEVLRHTLRLLGNGKVVWLHADFGSLIHELESGRIDIVAAGMFITPARAQRVIFTRPTAAIYPGLLVRRNNPLDLNTLRDMAARSNARLAVIDGSVEQQLAREAGLPVRRIMPYPDASAATAAVKAGDADALMLSMISLRHFLAEARTDEFELIGPFAAGDGHPAGLPAFAMRPADKRLRDAIDKELASFLGGPAHLQLVRPFGFRADDLAPTPRESGQ